MAWWKPLFTYFRKIRIAKYVREARRTVVDKVTKAINIVKPYARSLQDVIASWWLYKNTTATEANTAATSANTAATDTNTVMATEAEPDIACRVSSMIQRAWGVVKKTFAYVGPAYAGYLIYTLLFHGRSSAEHTILKALTIGFGVYIGVAVLGGLTTGLCVAGGAATGWCIDKYRSWQTPSRRSTSGIRLDVYVYEHRCTHFRVHVS